MLFRPPLLLLPQWLHLPVPPLDLFSLTKLNFAVYLPNTAHILLYSNNKPLPTCLSPLQLHLPTPLFGPMFVSWAPRRLLDPEERSRETLSQKHLGHNVLRVITHAWPLNGHVCYPHNNASRAAKSFIAPPALMVAPCQTHTHTPHTRACFPLWSPQVILQQIDLKRMQGGTNSHGKTHHLHQTLKVGLFGAHLRALALGGGGAVGLSRLDRCACYETLTHIYPRCLPMKNSGSCSG